MKIQFLDSGILRTCGVCGYKHLEKPYNHPNKHAADSEYGNIPFKVGSHQLFYDSSLDHGRGSTERDSVYVCPRCGVLQIRQDDRIRIDDT